MILRAAKFQGSVSENENEVTTMTTNEPKRRPWIGFIGLVLLLFGCLLSSVAHGELCILGSIGLLAVGLALLVYALFTGNMKLFG